MKIDNSHTLCSVTLVPYCEVFNPIPRGGIYPWTVTTPQASYDWGMWLTAGKGGGTSMGSGSEEQREPLASLTVFPQLTSFLYNHQKTVLLMSVDWMTQPRFSSGVFLNGINECHKNYLTIKGSSSDKPSLSNSGILKCLALFRFHCQRDENDLDAGGISNLTGALAYWDRVH